MSNGIETFGGTAKSLARNPLGIIALFMVLVYALAALTTAFAGSFSPAERLPLIYFMVGFPILVLATFSWLVSQHSGKLYAPRDFKDEENYVKMQLAEENRVKMQLAAVASLSAATVKGDAPVSEADMDEIVQSVQAASSQRAFTTQVLVGLHPSAENAPEPTWKNKVLWVDDRPENNAYERRAFEAIGLRFTLALSTDEAFERLAQSKYAAIISDMGRREGPREGYVLLDRLRAERDNTPVFFYAASSEIQHKRETAEHGGQGCTNNAKELFEMVSRSVIQGMAT